MKKLCEKHDDAKRKGESTMFTVDELWKDNDDLSAFAQDQIAPLVIRFFRDELWYIIQYPDNRISITDKGGQHCGDPDESFTLPESYQPSKIRWKVIYAKISRYREHQISKEALLYLVAFI